MNRVEAMARVLCEAEARGTVGMTERQARQHWYRSSAVLRDGYRAAARKALARFDTLVQLSPEAHETDVTT